jgi:hypothetical protein
MKVEYVTLTGADDTVDPYKLVELGIKYPYAEWAILFSQKKTGNPRYPTNDWLDELINVSSDHFDMNFSAHLCGKWVDDVMAGNFTFLKFTKWKLRFQRIQLNMGKDRLQQATTCKPLLDAVKSAGNHQVIFGGNYKYIKVDGDFFADNMLFPLFDASGGRGVETKEWPKPFTSSGGITMLHGYAGGLGPDNVAAELKRIEQVAEDAIIWIDMETKIRSVVSGKDVFDLKKCEEVLQIAQSWVK